MKSQQENESQREQELNEKYKILKEIGAGAQGSVFCIREISSGHLYASKLYKKLDRFLLEEEILKQLSKEEGFPRVHETLIVENHPLLIMDQLGENLRALKDKNGGRLSESTCLQIMLQLITRLEKLHEKGYVHCDLKPDNILIGRRSDDQNIIYLIDYGLAHSFIDPVTNKHMDHPQKTSFKGSISYCSLNLLSKYRKYSILSLSFKLVDPSRRDDLESLIYVILFLLLGQLPWHFGAQSLKGPERLNYVIKLKQELSIQDYGLNLPSYKQDPDYDFLKYVLMRDIQQQDNNNQTFEWTQSVSIQNNLRISSIQAEPVILRKSLTDKQINKDSIEDKSLEMEYDEFLSKDIDEGVNVELQQLSPKSNQLSNISPGSNLPLEFSNEKEFDETSPSAQIPLLLHKISSEKVQIKRTFYSSFKIPPPICNLSRDDVFNINLTEQEKKTPSKQSKELEDLEGPLTDRESTFQTSAEQARKILNKKKYVSDSQVN